MIDPFLEQHIILVFSHNSNKHLVIKINQLKPLETRILVTKTKNFLL